MKGKILITFFVAIFLLTLLPNNIIEIVGATSVVYPIGFEGSVIGSDYSDTLLSTHQMTGTFKCINTPIRSGTRSFRFGGNGYFNISYSKISFLTNFSMYLHGFGWTSGATTLNFYNKTYTSSKPMITIIFQANGSVFYTDTSGISRQFVSTAHDYRVASFNKFYFNILNDIGDCYYGASYSGWSSRTTGVVRNATLINSDVRIDRLYITTATAQVIYIDDLNFTISTSYTVGGTTGGCIDVSDIDYYSKNIEVMDGYIDISTPYIEFTSHSMLSITPEVFEFWVGSALYEGDSDTSNYFLYINGVSVGNPECFYLLSGETYVMQWDLSTFSPISEEVLIFEVAHTNTFDGTHYWNIAKSTPSYIYGPPSPTMITYRNTGTNGVLDGSPYYYGSCWKLYYSAFGTPEEEENTDFNVGLSLIGFNTHSVYNVPYSYIYDTVFFEVFSNRTDNYYHINISKGSSPMGNEQNYPKDIYSYHVIHGFTPTSQGNYTVSLCKDSTNTIVDHKHFNVTTKTVDYAIFTFPNPSNTGTNHGVGVYISDDSTFLNFYVSGVADSDNVNNYTLATRKIKVGTLDINKYWSTSLVTFASGGWEYWRLWGTNDNVSFIPLTSVYQHYVNRLTTNNYIRTSLTNGEGYVGESFNVYGQHGYILSELQVYLDNKPIKDVSLNVSFLIPYSFSSVGTHTFSLRILNDGEWETVDSVVVSIVFKPSGDGELSGLLPPPYSYIMGAIITIALMILPSIGLGKIGMSESESLKYVPIFSGTIGFILSCLIGFFPWYSIFALLFVLIMIIVILYLSKKN